MKRAIVASAVTGALVLSMGAKGGCDSSTSNGHTFKVAASSYVGVSVGGTGNTSVRVSYLIDPHVGTVRKVVHIPWSSRGVKVTQHTVVTINATVLERHGVAICAIYEGKRRIDRAEAKGKGHTAYCKANFVPPATERT